MVLGIPPWLVVGSVSCMFWFLLDYVATLIPAAQLRRVGAQQGSDVFLPNLVHHACIGSAALLVWAFEASAEVKQPLRSYLCLGPASSLAEVLPQVTLGYGIHDLVYGLRKGQASFWLHGCLLCLFYGCACHVGVAHYTSRVLAINLSTVFLTLRRLDLGALPNRCVDLLFVASFAVLRLGVLVVWWVQFLLHGWRSDPREWGACMHRGILLLALVAGGAMHSLNFYWFVHICRKVYAKVRGREPLREAGVGTDDDPGKLR